MSDPEEDELDLLEEGETHFPDLREEGKFPLPEAIVSSIVDNINYLAEEGASYIESAREELRPARDTLVRFIRTLGDADGVPKFF